MCESYNKNNFQHNLVDELFFNNAFSINWMELTVKAVLVHR